MRISDYCFSFTQRTRKSVHSKLLLLAIVFSVLSLAGWSYIFYVVSIQNWAYLWMPLSNLGAISISVYIDGDIASLAMDLANLENSKYSVKEV
jgi:hypothetical protein